MNDGRADRPSSPPRRLATAEYDKARRGAARWPLDTIIMETIPGRTTLTAGFGEPDGEALENQWSSAAVRHYRAAEPSRLGKDVPLYTL
ncbi:hypothetical protein [Streptomyces sp. NPDC049906]|uniref:hypothetical protein n=1 Tax=Streptomyces sp. NPDC049906 TaxID=3155656 RepID=UPI00341745F8